MKPSTYQFDDLSHLRIILLIHLLLGSNLVEQSASAPVQVLARV
jgi:hypothetical protein